MNCTSCGSAECPCFAAGQVAGALKVADGAGPELASYGEKLIRTARGLIGASVNERRAGRREMAAELAKWAVDVEAVARLLIQQIDRTPGPVGVG